MHGGGRRADGRALEGLDQDQTKGMRCRGCLEAAGHCDAVVGLLHLLLAAVWHTIPDMGHFLVPPKTSSRGKTRTILSMKNNF